MFLGKIDGRLVFSAVLLVCLGLGAAEQGAGQKTKEQSAKAAEQSGQKAGAQAAGQKSDSVKSDDVKSDTAKSNSDAAKADDTPKAKTDELGKSLDLTPDSKSLPVWAQPGTDATYQLAHMIRASMSSVFLVGKTDVGTGTAFLISKKNRLLATNAHVADMFYEGSTDMLAYENGTSKAFKVVKVYIHPGVMRSGKGVRVRSPDPKKGDVVGRSPDVAILQLADGDELPDELPLGTQAELYDLFAQPIAMLGFPGNDTSSLPGADQKAEATFREGVVNRVSDFTNNAGGPSERQQYLQHSMANWFGFSGSPIFLPNGHVVALNNSGTTLSKNGLSTTIAWGIRADCVWEVLKANHLLDKVNLPPEAAAVDVARFSQPDPETAKVQKVDHLLADAKQDFRLSHYQDALDKCNEAAKEMPNYAPVYGVRGDIYLNTAAMSMKSDDPKRRQYYQSALGDKKHAVELDPNNTTYYLDEAIANVNLANLDRAPGSKVLGVDSAVQVADKMLKDDSISTFNKTYANRVRAAGMGYTPDSLEYLQKADALYPFNSDVKWSLGLYYGNNNDPEESKRQKELSRTLMEVGAKSDTAFTLATSADDTKRDGQKSLQMAKEACESTDYKCYYALTALAVASAETGDFVHAIQYQQKATQGAPDFLKAIYMKRLVILIKHKPVRS